MSKNFQIQLDNTKQWRKDLDFSNKFKLCFISESDLLLVVEWLRPFNLEELYLSNANYVYKIKLDLPQGTTIKDFKWIFNEIKKSIKKDFSDTLECNRFMIIW